MALKRIVETVEVKSETEHVGGDCYSVVWHDYFASVFCMNISISMECMVILLAKI